MFWRCCRCARAVDVFSPPPPFFSGWQEIGKEKHARAQGGQNGTRLSVRFAYSYALPVLSTLLHRRRKMRAALLLQTTPNCRFHPTTICPTTRAFACCYSVGLFVQPSCSFLSTVMLQTAARVEVTASSQEHSIERLQVFACLCSAVACCLCPLSCRECTHSFVTRLNRFNFSCIRTVRSQAAQGWARRGGRGRERQLCNRRRRRAFFLHLHRCCCNPRIQACISNCSTNCITPASLTATRAPQIPITLSTPSIHCSNARLVCSRCCKPPTPNASNPRRPPLLPAPTLPPSA